MRRLIRPLIFFSLLAGCATTQPAPLPPEAEAPPAPGPSKAPLAPAQSIQSDSPYYRPEIVRLREEAITLVRQQAEAVWKNWTAGEPLDLAATYAGHDQLFTPDAVKLVRDARLAAQGDAARALLYLENYLAGEIVARASADASDELISARERATLATSGAPSYLKLDQLLAGEASADQRARLYAAELPVIAKLDPLVQKRQAAIDGALKELGYDSTGSFIAALRGMDLVELANLAERTLEATDDLYEHTMDRLALDQLALPLAKLRRSDLPRLFRTELTDNAFPSAKAAPMAVALFHGLGLDPDQPALHLDAAPTPKKNSRALCVPVVVPTDVRVSFKPRPGVEAYRELLFQLGHGQEDVHVARTEWEFQMLGPNAPGESFAMLFQDLVESPDWLKTWPDMKADQAFGVARRAAIQRLFLLRRYAGRVQFEALLTAGLIKEPPADAYRRIMSHALGVKLTADDGKRYLTDIDPFLDSADYFLAWVLQGHIESRLAEKYGASWWTSPAAGKELATLWAEGRHLTIDDIVRWSGETKLNPLRLTGLLVQKTSPK